MMVYRENWVCMDCEREFAGHIDEDNDVILCPKCSKAFEEFVNEDESRSYTLYWLQEFIRIYGHRKEREERARSQFLDELIEQSS